MSAPDDFKPGNYVKNGNVRRADTPADAVNLKFAGYVPADSVETPRAELQKQAKELGIDARQSTEKLREAVAAADTGAPAGGEPPVDLGEDSPVGDGSGGGASAADVSTSDYSF